MTADVTTTETPTTETPTTETERLRAEVRELRAALDGLTARLDRGGSDGGGSHGRAIDLDPTTNRRGLLRLAGAAAVGAIGATAAAAAPAAAETGYTIGGSTSVGDVVTQTLNGSVPGKNGFQFATFGGPANNVSATPAVVAALAVDPAARRAVYAHSAVQFGIGVQGVTPDAVDGVGVQGNGMTGVRAVGGLVGVAASGDTAVSAAGARLGGEFSGGRANMRLAPSGSAPAGRADEHATGEVLVDADGGLWFCVVGGTPGAWRKVSGPTTAGVFHVLDPTRVYDSRVPAPTPGRLRTGRSRTIDLEFARSRTTGAASPFLAVPRGATGAVLSVEVVDPRGSGELEVLRTGVRSQFSRQVVWGSGDGDRVHEITTRVSRDSRVLVRSRGAGSCHLVVHVLGYYR